MDAYNKNLGTKRILGFFPTMTVAAYITTELHQFWTSQKINDMYMSYKEAVLDEGLASYPGNNGEVVPYIVEKTGYEKNDVWIFLVSLIELVKEGKIDKKYLNIELQRGTILEKVEGAIPDPTILPDFEKIVKAIKWAGIGTAIVLGLYLVRPVLKMASK